MQGSFRDLHLNDAGGNNHPNGRNLKNRSSTSAGNPHGHDPNPNLNNYSTFSNDQVCSICVCANLLADERWCTIFVAESVFRWMYGVGIDLLLFCVWILFASVQSVQTLLRQSDKIEHTKKVMHESEEVAKNVLVDLELQRSQMQDMKGMLHETSSITGEVRSLLQKIADRSYRRKVCDAV